MLQRQSSVQVEPKLLVDFRQLYVFCTCKTIFFLSLVKLYRIGLTEDDSSAKTTVTIRNIKEQWASPHIKIELVGSMGSLVKILVFRKVTYSTRC